ncbi:MAG: aldehyde dehydrogenase family protein [Alphaproteobacteria bacterium]|nr:aldehyde dehydrogenase family protein [Alphaproteobacteria bacterium]MBU1559606.1 aldehyde dehydrogenase family protein [Alphaproteobacteria bacterium]MBU2304395.1 aldehyde dehydrogenase family protein [Alphaproteobacteria bacterium]MBU2367180.1 aldehyde dehydrogenase family protein [Alphaproteobacteria bacterium]
MVGAHEETGLRGLADAFANKVVERAKNTVVGFDKNSPIVTGPLIDGRAWKRVKGLVDDAVANGGRGRRLRLHGRCEPLLHYPRRVLCRPCPRRARRLLV